MSEKETLKIFSKAIRTLSPKTKSAAQKYMVELGVATNKGNLNKNYKHDYNIKTVLTHE